MEEQTHMQTATEKEEHTDWRSSKHWLRLLFMLVFAGISYLAILVLWAVVIFQFIHSLFTGESHDKLRAFGSSLSRFLYQIFRFLTYNTDEKPFPFADWPYSEGEDFDRDRSDS